MKSPLFLAFCLTAIVLPAPAAPLVVHEWGTFTSLQDESGNTIAGINSDDEPVPKFCHDLDWRLILKPDELPAHFYQGAPSCHPDVTMRLETPVIYFHPPKDAQLPITATVKVAFHGGWLTQFYPAAESSKLIPGDNFSSGEKLTERTVGTLAWTGIQIGAKGIFPKTTNRVWTAPRAVDAAPVRTFAGAESEQFLFYRGVGHLECPLLVNRTADGKTLQCRSHAGKALTDLPQMSIKQLWLASFRADGACAYRKLDSVTLNQPTNDEKRPVLFTTPAKFPKTAYSAANLRKLRGEMREALQGEGLFQDEAEALLNTWELSYFKSAGLRLFFMVPREWTDHYLPLEISVPSEISRAMVGRLELVTPEQRALLKQQTTAPVPTNSWAAYVMKDGQMVINPPVGNRGSFPATRGSMPDAYRNLGRFRNALILDEVQHRPSPSLEAFIKLNNLEAFRR